MFHVPYDTMAMIHAKRVVADSTIIMAVGLFMSEMDVSDGLRNELRICEQAKNNALLLNQELAEKEATSRADVNKAEGVAEDLRLDVARLRPWATIGKIGVYGTLAVAVFLGVNEALDIVPSINLFP